MYKSQLKKSVFTRQTFDEDDLNKMKIIGDLLLQIQEFEVEIDDEDDETKNETKNETKDEYNERKGGYIKSRKTKKNRKNKKITKIRKIRTKKKSIRKKEKY